MKIITAAIIYCVAAGTVNAQSCGNCKITPSVALYDLDVQVPQPEVNNLKGNEWLEWLQLFWLNKFASSSLFQTNKNCIRFTQPIDSRISDESFITKDGIEVPPLNEESDQIKVGQTYTNIPPGGDVSRFGDYILTGNVSKAGSGYTMRMELQTACSRKTVAYVNVPFQISAESANTMSIAQQAAGQLSPLIEKIKAFEIKERQENTKVALDEGMEEAITIKPKKRNLAIGEQTEIEITLKDCDGQTLGNREVVFTKGSLNGMSISAGTTGGTVTPSSVITDGAGKAKATFKMTSATAIIDAHHVFTKPYGCESVKLGSTPIGGTPIKVEVSYFQNETRTLKRATLPGLKVSGGNQKEQFHTAHTTVLFHYPSQADLKKGYLVMAEKDNEPDSKTEYMIESGYYDYAKHEEDAEVIGLVGNVEAVLGKEKGSSARSSGTASLNHPSEVMFYKGDINNPPQFSWFAEYPTSNDGIGSSGMVIVKGEEGVKWMVNKITDPNSPYKTEYLLALKLDAAEELKKGNKAMKDLFGFDLDGLTKAIDPTKEQPGEMAGASGSQAISVRILSPYADEKEK